MGRATPLEYGSHHTCSLHGPASVAMYLARGDSAAREGGVPSASLCVTTGQVKSSHTSRDVTVALGATDHEPYPMYPSYPDPYPYPYPYP